MRRFIALSLFVCLSILALLVTGCARELPIELVKVEEVLPRSFERGDRLEIRGEGFPQGRTARVTLTGMVHRPGALPEQATIVTEGVVTAPERIEVAVDEHFESMFCGSGADADHTSFDGEISIAFAPRSTTAASVGATLQAVSLDMHPAVIDAEKRTSESDNGKRTLQFLGIENVDSAAGGLVLRGVAPGSRADVLGLSPGDVVTSFGGLRVSDVRDLSASAMGPLVPISFLRVSGQVETRELSVIGLSGAAPQDLSLALMWVAALVAFLVSFALPLKLRFASFEASLASGARRVAMPSGATLYVPLAVALAAAIAVLAPTGISAELDVPLVASSVFALTLLDAIERGASKQAILRSVGAASLAEFPTLVAMITLGAASGGIGLFDAARAQGALPWHWVAFKSPLALGAVLVVFTSRFARGETRVTGFSALSASLVGFVLAFEAFGGGAIAHGESMSSIFSAVLVLVKTVALAFTLLLLPRLGVFATAAKRSRFAWKLPAIASLVLLAVTLASARFGVPLALRERVAMLVVIGVTLVLLRVLLRVASAVRVREPHADPFI